MKDYLYCGITVCAFIIALNVAANAQKQPTRKDDSGGDIASSVLKTTGKVPIVIVGSAAKAGWAVTKFTATRVAAPMAKTLIVKGTPKAAQLMLKTTEFGIKRALPLVVKLSLL